VPASGGRTVVSHPLACTVPSGSLTSASGHSLLGGRNDSARPGEKSVRVPHTVQRVWIREPVHDKSIAGLWRSHNVRRSAAWPRRSAATDFNGRVRRRPCRYVCFDIYYLMCLRRTSLAKLRLSRLTPGWRPASCSEAPGGPAPGNASFEADAQHRGDAVTSSEFRTPG